MTDNVISPFDVERFEVLAEMNRTKTEFGAKRGKDWRVIQPCQGEVGSTVMTEHKQLSMVKAKESPMYEQGTPHHVEKLIGCAISNILQ